MPTDKGPAERTKAVTVLSESINRQSSGDAARRPIRVDGHRFSVRSAWERVEAASEAATFSGALERPLSRTSATNP